VRANLVASLCVFCIFLMPSFVCDMFVTSVSVNRYIMCANHLCFCVLKTGAIHFLVIFLILKIYVPGF